MREFLVHNDDMKIQTQEELRHKSDILPFGPVLLKGFKQFWLDFWAFLRKIDIYHCLIKTL